MAHNNQNSETTKTRALRIASDILHIVCDFLMVVCRIIVKALMWTSRNVWERYFNIETPVYKWWWSMHAQRMQKQLDKCHQINCL